jgi:hypothetical protein
MLTEYIQAAIDAITWKIMPDGSFYAEISQLGLKTSHAHLDECQCQIREMLEEYIVISLYRHNPLPAIGGRNLKPDESVNLQL